MILEEENLDRGSSFRNRAPILTVALEVFQSEKLEVCASTHSLSSSFGGFGGQTLLCLSLYDLVFLPSICHISLISVVVFYEILRL